MSENKDKTIEEIMDEILSSDDDDIIKPKKPEWPEYEDMGNE